MKLVPRQPLVAQQAPTGSTAALQPDVVQFWLAVKVLLLPQSAADATWEQLPCALQQLANATRVCCAALLAGCVSGLVVLTTAVVVWLPDCSAVTGSTTVNGLLPVRVPTTQVILPLAAVQPAGVDTSCRPAGSVAVTVTFAASFRLSSFAVNVRSNTAPTMTLAGPVMATDTSTTELGSMLVLLQQTSCEGLGFAAAEVLKN